MKCGVSVSIIHRGGRMMFKWRDAVGSQYQPLWSSRSLGDQGPVCSETKLHRCLLRDCFDAPEKYHEKCGNVSAGEANCRGLTPSSLILSDRQVPMDWKIDFGDRLLRLKRAMYLTSINLGYIENKYYAMYV